MCYLQLKSISTLRFFYTKIEERIRKRRSIVSACVTIFTSVISKGSASDCDGCNWFNIGFVYGLHILDSDNGICILTYLDPC